MNIFVNMLIKVNGEILKIRRPLTNIEMSNESDMLDVLVMMKPLIAKEYGVESNKLQILEIKTNITEDDPT